jgi:hypothetical protein
VGVQHFVKTCEVSVGSRPRRLLRREKYDSARACTEPHEIGKGLLLRDFLTIRIPNRKVRTKLAWAEPSLQPPKTCGIAQAELNPAVNRLAESVSNVGVAL